MIDASPDAKRAAGMLNRVRKCDTISVVIARFKRAIQYSRDGSA
jgi:hypothetical protein